MSAVPRGSAFAVGISSHHTKHVEIHPLQRCGAVADKNKWMEINMKILNWLFSNSRRMASYPMMDMMCKTLKTPSRRFFILDYLHHCCMEYCVFVIAPTIDIETAPLTPSIARRFTSARSGDSWCWGLVHVIRVHLVADFGDVSAVSRWFFPSVFLMATVSHLLQPGQSHSYGQILKLGRYA
jgi:hypothetical protein